MITVVKKLNGRSFFCETGYLVLWGCKCGEGWCLLVLLAVWSPVVARFQATQDRFTLRVKTLVSTSLADSSRWCFSAK